MIRMSKLADYSFLLLVHMVGEQDESWAASALAEATGLPLPTVAKLMKMLAKGGLVVAQRGANGGYRLAYSPAKITVASVIEAVDGPISLTECVVKNVDDGCQARNFCALHGGWDKLSAVLRSALTSVTLADMACI